MDFTTIVHAVNDGFEFDGCLNSSSDRFLSLSSPSNTYVWNILALYSSAEKNLSRLDHAFTAPMVAHESREPVENRTRIDRRSLVESTSWSPIGLSASGASLLATGVHSDGSVHLKLYEPVSNGLEYTLMEKECLVSELRSQWLQIPLFGFKDRKRDQVTSEYPSVSYLLDNPGRSSLAWLDTVIFNQGLLATGWNNMVFIWSVSGKGPARVLCALLLTEKTVSNARFCEVRDLGCDRVEVFLKVQTVLGGSEKWTLVLSRCSNRETICVYSASREEDKERAITSLSKNLNHKSYFSDSIRGGVALAACSSPNDAFDFVVKRTSRSVEILCRISQEMASLEAAMEQLIKAAQTRPRTHLMDIAKAMTTLYTPRDEKVRDYTFFTSPFNSVIQKFLPGSSLDVSGDLGVRLAFGLNHLHSRIDPFAGKTDYSFKRDVLKLFGSHVDSDMKCIHCDAHPCEVSEDLTFAKCRLNGHRFLLCQRSLRPIDRQTGVVQCTFCESIVQANFEEAKSIDICKLCRIGLTQSL